MLGHSSSGLQSRLTRISWLGRRMNIIIKAHVVESSLIRFVSIFTSSLRSETWIFMLVREMMGHFFFHLVCEWFIWKLDQKSSSIYLEWLHWYLHSDECTTLRPLKIIGGKLAL